MTTVVIVQARMGSTRLPGKVVASINGEPSLVHTLRRAKKIRGVEAVVVAAPDEKESFAIRDAARRLNVHTFLGSEGDVLDRFLCAAVWIEPLIGKPVEHVMRITADCPLIDPDVCTEVLEWHLESKCDYSSNVWPRSFPLGLDCEVFTYNALLQAFQSATRPFDREHVTPWIVKNMRRSIAVKSEAPELVLHRWVLDYPDDLKFIRDVFAVRDPKSMRDVLKILEEHPELAARSYRPSRPPPNLR